MDPPSQCLTDQVSPSESHDLSTQTPAGGKGSRWGCLSPRIFPGVMGVSSSVCRAVKPFGKGMSPFGRNLPPCSPCHCKPPFFSIISLSLLGLLVGEFWLFGCRLSLLQPVLGTSHPTLSYHLLQEIQHLDTL